MKFNWKVSSRSWKKLIKLTDWWISPLLYSQNFHDETFLLKVLGWYRDINIFLWIIIQSKMRNKIKIIFMIYADLLKPFSSQMVSLLFLKIIHFYIIYLPMNELEKLILIWYSYAISFLFYRKFLLLLEVERIQNGQLLQTHRCRLGRLHCIFFGFHYLLWVLLLVWSDVSKRLALLWVYWEQPIWK